MNFGFQLHITSRKIAMNMITNYPSVKFITKSTCLLTMVVSAIEPKLFMNMLHVTLTGEPEKEIKTEKLFRY